MKSVLFVCLGNICRSPIAEGIARQIASERGLDIKVDSAGTGSWHVGEAPCEHSVRIANSRGVDISAQRARQIQKKDFETFDVIIALDQNNYDNLKRLGAGELFKLGDFGYNGADVPDPFFFPGYEGFDKVFEMIGVCVHNLIQKNYKGHL